MSQSSDASRDLLFGLLGLQTGLIDQEALFAAFAAWTARKDFDAWPTISSSLDTSMPRVAPPSRPSPACTSRPPVATPRKA